MSNSFEKFSQYLFSFLSDNDARSLSLALSETKPVVSVRRNSRKTNDFAAGFSPVPWCSKGVYLEDRIPFTFDPLLHAGCYYVQDASSMVYERIIEFLRPKFDDLPIKYLDLCAAPGGKTTAALDALHDEDFVMANEINPSRAKILAENVAKWGAANCYISSVDSARISSMGEFFDIIAVDAPCSGEGMMRKDDDAVSQWSLSLVKECAKRQQEILDNAWFMLAAGGYIIYSTCTFNRLENEEILNYLLSKHGAESIDLQLESIGGISPGINADGFCYRFMPHQTKGEGLFVAVVRKQVGNQNIKLKSCQPKRGANKLPLPRNVETLLMYPHNYEIKCSEDKVTATPKSHLNIVSHVCNYINLWNTGVLLGSIKGRDLVPEHSLALSNAFNQDSMPGVDVNYSTAIAYLRGETFALPIDTPRGLVRICYEGITIGFMKNLGSRANTLMQKEWRIRSTHFLEPASQIVIPV